MSKCGKESTFKGAILYTTHTHTHTHSTHIQNLSVSIFVSLTVSNVCSIIAVYVIVYYFKKTFREDTKLD